MGLYVLDCTLRDGGYVNSWEFQPNSITKIINNICASNIDIIEVGFLNSQNGNSVSTLFETAETASKYIETSKINASSNCVAMIMHNQFDCTKLPERKDVLLSGIRYCFKKEYIEKALENCRLIRNKGYDVYLQPAALSDYNDKEVLDLVTRANNIDICAFYIVDTFGVMRKNDVVRYFLLIDRNLKENVSIGFHSHNNLQLSFSNAQDFIQVSSNRDIIIDSSIFGMGRGAGNLCTELITQYINENIENKYDIIPILEAMDEYIMPIYSQHPWGYSAPYYIAATNNCHPNYATFLMNKETLCIRDINTIIKSIPDENKHLYSEDLISKMYLDYQQKSVDDSLLLNNLSTLCSRQAVLIIAPGRSTAIYEKKILEFIEKEKPFVFAVNHIPKHLKYDKVFVSNLKRFKGIDDAIEKLGSKLICTSNIVGVNSSQKLNYSTYLNDDEIILDNAGLMLINVLRKAGVKKIYLAGYDGFSYSEKSNYCDEKLINQVKYERQTELNAAMKKYFERVRKNIEIEFITPSIYNSGENNE